jgi:hypothetical protein
MDKKTLLKSLCVLGMLFFMMVSVVPLFIPQADAAFASVTITDARPTELHPGDTKEVTVTVRNNGGRDAKDIRLAFHGTDNLSVIGPTVAQINTLISWQSKEVLITVHVKEEAQNGIYSIPIACSWRDFYLDPAKGYVTTNKTKEQLGISFNVIGAGVLNIGDITTDPTDIRPGDENVKLTVDIENSGEAAAKDVEAKLLCNAEFKPAWSGTDRSYIGRLNSGDSKEATFHVDVSDNIESNTYTIPMRISYKDTRGREYEAMRSVEILVEPKPDFVIVSFHTEPESISAGDNAVKLHVKVKNMGSEKAQSVSVRITDEADVPFDYEVKSDYVGTLKVGDAREAVLEFDVKKKAEPKEYPQGIEIRCTGDRDLGDDNVYIFDEQILLAVSSGRSSGGFSVQGFGVVFAFIALVFAFVMRRKGM